MSDTKPRAAVATRTTVTETVKVEHEAIQLTLTPKQAQTLTYLMCAVGGSPHTTRRADCDSIHAALRALGFEGYDSEGLVVNGNIYFKG